MLQISNKLVRLKMVENAKHLPKWVYHFIENIKV